MVNFCNRALERVPEEAAYLRNVARMCFLNNFYLRLVMNRAGFTKAMEAELNTAKNLADAMFGPIVPLPAGYVSGDAAAIPNEFAAMFAAFGLIDPARVPKSAEPPASTPPVAAPASSSTLTE